MTFIEIAQYINQHESRFSSISSATLLEYLAIVMKNNMFQFSNTL